MSGVQLMSEISGIGGNTFGKQTGANVSLDGPRQSIGQRDSTDTQNAMDFHANKKPLNKSNKASSIPEESSAHEVDSRKPKSAR